MTKRNKDKWRDAVERLQKGKKIQEKQLAEKDPSLNDEGIKGPPALMNLYYFDETSSHVSDTLHVVCHGLVKDMLRPMVKKVGESFSFQKEKQPNFDYQDYLQSSITFPSEYNHQPPSLSLFHTKWKGLDFLFFLLHQVVLLVADDDIISDEKVYPCFVHLSNAIYLLHHGKFDETKRKLAQQEITSFSEKFVDCYTAEYCTNKFHVFQHFGDLAKIHGPAYLWDAFIGKHQISY